MKFPKFILLSISLWLMIFMSAHAQSFPLPGKAIRIIVPWAAGGPTDSQARVIGSELSKELGVPVVVENKAGASGSIGAREVIRAVPDGHTLLYTVDAPMTQTPHLQKNLPFDPVKDFVLISRVAEGGVVLVGHPSVPAKNLQELLAYIRGNQGKVSFASFGAGTVSHIYGEMLSLATNGQMIHVAYKGSAEAMKDLLSGRVQLMFDSPSIAEQYVSSGKLHIYGGAGEKRRSTMPDLPTLAEQGLSGFEIRGFQAFFGSSAVPVETQKRLNEAIRRAQSTANVKATLEKMGFEPVDESLDYSAKRWRNDYDRWGEYIHRANVRIE